MKFYRGYLIAFKKIWLIEETSVYIPVKPQRNAICHKGKLNGLIWKYVRNQIQI